MAYPATCQGRLNPFTLALTLPRVNILPLINYFTRRLSGFSMRAPHWLHLMNLVVMAVATATSGVPALATANGSRTVPYLWEFARKWYQAYVERNLESLDRLKDTGMAMLGVVEWIYGSLRTREENFLAWCKCAEWSALLDLMMDLASKVSEVLSQELTNSPKVLK